MQTNVCWLSRLETTMFPTQQGKQRLLGFHRKRRLGVYRLPYLTPLTVPMLLPGHVATQILQYLSTIDLCRNGMFVCRYFHRQSKLVLKKRQDLLCKLEFIVEGKLETTTFTVDLRLSMVFSKASKCIYEFTHAADIGLNGDVNIANVRFVTLSMKRILEMKGVSLRAPIRSTYNVVAYNDKVCIHIAYHRITLFRVFLYVTEHALFQFDCWPSAGFLQQWRRNVFIQARFNLISTEQPAPPWRTEARWDERQPEYYAVLASFSPTPNEAVWQCLTNLTFPALVNALAANAPSVLRGLRPLMHQDLSLSHILCHGVSKVKHHLCKVPFGIELFTNLLSAERQLDGFVEILRAFSPGDKLLNWRIYRSLERGWGVSELLALNVPAKIIQLTKQIVETLSITPG